MSSAAVMQVPGVQASRPHRCGSSRSAAVPDNEALALQAEHRGRRCRRLSRPCAEKLTTVMARLGELVYEGLPPESALQAR